MLSMLYCGPIMRIFVDFFHIVPKTFDPFAFLAASGAGSEPERRSRSGLGAMANESSFLLASAMSFSRFLS